MIIFVGGTAFQIKRIDGTQWAICILCALPCLLWAVLLRCIPDAYAAVFFAFANRIFLIVATPILKALKIIFSPVAKLWRILRKTIFSRTKRFCKRTTAKVLRKKPAPATDDVPQDEEAGLGINMTEPIPPKTPDNKGKASMQGPTPQASPEQLLHPPPITLTTA